MRTDEHEGQDEFLGDPAAELKRARVVELTVEEAQHAMRLITQFIDYDELPEGDQRLYRKLERQS